MQKTLSNDGVRALDLEEVHTVSGGLVAGDGGCIPPIRKLPPWLPPVKIPTGGRIVIWR